MIHNTAEISNLAKIGKDVMIWNNVQIRENVTIGDRTILGTGVYIDKNVSVGSDVKIENNTCVFWGVNIEDDVFIGPGVTFSNDLYPRANNDTWKVEKTMVKNGCSIGANSTVVAGIEIGEYALVGAGSVVTRDVQAHELVYGNPARHKGYVCRCGKKLNCRFMCNKCGKSYIQDEAGHVMEKST